jgi:hypothetical protein
MVDRERLAELRAKNKAERDELAADIERRELEDPFDWQEVTRSTAPVVFKTHETDRAYANAEPAPPQLSDDDLADTIAELLAEAHDEIRSEFEARIAVLEARVDTLVAMVSGDPARAKSMRRKLSQDDSHLLEAPRRNPS